METSEAAGPEEAAREVPEEIFSAADLETYVAPRQPYPMPGGKKVWVAGMSLDDVIHVNTEAAREVGALFIRDEREQALQRRLRAYAHQAARACYAGEGKEAPRVFKDADAARLRERLGWEPIRQIVELSDSLGAGPDGLTESALEFLGLVEACLQRKDAKAILPQVAAALAAVREAGEVSTADRLRLAEIAEGGK